MIYVESPHMGKLRAARDKALAEVERVGATKSTREKYAAAKAEARRAVAAYELEEPLYRSRLGQAVTVVRWHGSHAVVEFQDGWRSVVNRWELRGEGSCTA